MNSINTAASHHVITQNTNRSEKLKNLKLSNFLDTLTMDQRKEYADRALDGLHTLEQSRNDSIENAKSRKEYFTQRLELTTEAFAKAFGGLNDDQKDKWQREIESIKDNQKYHQTMFERHTNDTGTIKEMRSFAYKEAAQMLGKTIDEVKSMYAQRFSSSV